jgi:hypothetical protein
MKIHEYQGKEILARFGIPVPRGYPAFSVREASEAAQKLGGSVWVVKAQIHAGGRGKGGGVKVAKSPAEVASLAGQILGMQLKTKQTGPEVRRCAACLIEEGADIKKEYYVAVLTDRATQKVALMGSSEGGMDIEQVAHDTPEKILKVFIDPIQGLGDADAAKLATGIGIPAATVPQAVDVLKTPLRLLHGDRRVADRDQPADPRGRQERRPRRRSRRSTPSSTSTRTRSSASPRSPPTAISTRRTRPRSRPASSTSPTSSSTATSAAWSTAPAWRWRPWTRSSCSAASRPTSSTSAAAPRPRR